MVHRDVFALLRPFCVCVISDDSRSGPPPTEENMHRLSFDIPILDRDSILTTALAADWLAGLTLGIFAARFYGSALGDAIASAAVCTVSFSALVVVTLFPLLLSACAVFLFHAPGVYALCFLRGAALGAMTGAIAASFGAGGLLLGALLLFSSVLFCPVLFWYWRRRLTMGQGSFQQDTLCAILAGVGICGVDRLLIVPFLAEVITF